MQLQALVLMFNKLGVLVMRGGGEMGGLAPLIHSFVLMSQIPSNALQLSPLHRKQMEPLQEGAPSQLLPSHRLSLAMQAPPTFCRRSKREKKKKK